jgi:adenylate cyclase
LRVSDQQATKDYKRYTGTLPVYAHEMSIRYFVQGSVRKFGDQIKIAVSLLDIETGDHLWQDTIKGTMADVFEIQEQVAQKVVDGLKLHLTTGEKHKLAERGTENAEAYELFLRAQEYFDRQTKEVIQHGAQLFSDAIALDPAYAQAYSGKAQALAALYRSYNRDPNLLDEGLSLLQEAKRLKPDLPSADFALSLVLMHQGKLDEAERVAQDSVRSAPQDYLSHFSLGFFYMSIGQPEKAIAPFEVVLKLNPDNLVALWNLTVACHDVNEVVKLKQWALVAIPIYEKHLKLFPDDETRRVWHAVVLHFAGRDDDARNAAQRFHDLRDGVLLSITASLLCALKDHSSGIVAFRKAIEAGFRDIGNLRSFLEDEEEGIAALKGTPEWEAVREMVEKLEQDSAQTNHG